MQNQIKKEYRLKNGFYLKELKINRLDDRNGTREGWLISSGSIKKKHMDWVINLPDNSQKILINEEDIESYQNDETRDDRSNIIQKLNSKDADRDFPMGIPCFYKIISGENGKTKVLFGHTALFRIPYKQSINDQIEKVDEKKVDYSNSIFGKVEDNSGNIWLTTWDRGVYKYDGKEITNYPIKDSINNVNLVSMYKDKQGNLWLGTNDKGTFKFNGNTFEKFNP